MTGPRPSRRPLLVALRALGLGDLLTAFPALRALADAFPEHRRVLAAPEALRALALASGAVDAVVATAPLAPLPAELHGADVAVNLHGRGPESHRVLLDARPGRFIAFRHPAIPESASSPEWRADEHEVVRWCRLLDAHGIPADPRRLDLVVDPAAAPAVARGATLLHPGAASGARRWPVDRWVEVARAERAVGRPVTITGGPAEIPDATAIADAAGVPPEAVLAGRTGLAELAAAVAAADRVVCGDTGVAHLATAVGTPSVVLFGPVPPSEWGPPGDRPQHRALWARRRGDPHASHPDPGLLAVSVHDVVAALAELPANDGGEGNVC
ncbi:MAG TPA: glycosyltransferase family 9 protein [Egibacteraceae bacterium]|nr:glycosyltransferase family 9 protein [Egibacteraceae bacterium]